MATIQPKCQVMEAMPPGNHCYLLLFILMVAVLYSGCSKTNSDPIVKERSIGQAEEVGFSQSSPVIECYDFVEVTMNIASPVARNPFTDVSVSGHFTQLARGNDVSVAGFCDSPDGTVFRIRFMASKPGDYAYSVTYRHSDFERVYNGMFKAVEGKYRGILRVDPGHPWHFIWERSGEHCFVNGTTAFLLMGWDSEQMIRDCIDRLDGFKVNRM
jgi:hypothetical protein